MEGRVRSMKANQVSLLVLLAATMLAGSTCLHESRRQNLREHDPQPADSPNLNVRKPDRDMVLKLSILRSGTLLANGTEIQFDQLDLELSKLKCFEGRVLCYREDDQDESPAIAAEVIKRVMRYRLRLGLASQPDFSDTIDGPTASLETTEEVVNRTGC